MTESGGPGTRVHARAAHHRRAVIARRPRRHRDPTTGTPHRWSPLEELSPREAMILGAMMRGQSAKEISSCHFVAISTVRSQIRSILTKLGVSSQLAAVAVAHERGWRADGHVASSA